MGQRFVGRHRAVESMQMVPCVYSETKAGQRQQGLFNGAALGQTYIFFGAWGDFFHLFFSYFLWNLGIFVEISSGNGRNGRNGRIVTAVT